RENSATASYSQASGYQASATIPGGRTQAGGQISTKGDAQHTEVHLKIQTTDGNATALQDATTAQTLVLPNDSTWGFVALIAARRTDADGESAFYELKGCIDRNGAANTTALVGSLTTTVIAEDTE